MVAQRTRNYELVFVTSPEATEDELTALMGRVEELVTSNGGNISKQETWGLKKLAYPLKRFNEGNYLLLQFSLDGGSLAEINRGLNASEDIFRFLVIKV